MGLNNPFWQSAGGAAAISSVGSVGSGLFGGLFSAGSQRRQYKYNLRLQKQQQEWQKMMWDLQNQYNLPVNEIRRLLDAGVNPALAFSNGGASAAPVPHSGSAGGVSAPTADMPNVGAAAVVAAQNQQRLENETKVAESTSAKLDAEADESRARAGEASARKNLYELTYSIDFALKDTTIHLGKLNYAIRLFDRDLASNKLIRDNWTTSYHLQGVQLQQEGMRLGNDLKSAQIRFLNRDVDRVGALIDLYRSSRRLNDQQANLVACRVYASLASAFMGKMRYDATRRLSRATVTVDGKPRSFSDALFDQMSSSFAADLDTARNSALSSALDLAYSRQYGKESRDLMYNLQKQGFYKGRMDLWLGAERFILDAGSSFFSSHPEFNTPQNRELFDDISRSFDFRGSIEPDRSWQSDLDSPDRNFRVDELGRPIWRSIKD